MNPKKRRKKLKKKKNLLKKPKQRKLQLVKNLKKNLQVVDVVVGIQMKMKKRNLIQQKLQQNHQMKVLKKIFLFIIISYTNLSSSLFQKQQINLQRKKKQNQQVR